MPWIFNPKKEAELLQFRDGQEGLLSGRSRLYIDPKRISAQITAQIACGRLVVTQRDPEEVVVPVVSAVPAVPVVNTSSIHHELSAILPTESTIQQVIQDNKVDEIPVVVKEEIPVVAEKAEDSSEQSLKSDFGSRRHKRRP